MSTFANTHEAVPADGDRIAFEFHPSSATRATVHTGWYHASTSPGQPGGVFNAPVGGLKLARWGDSIRSWQPAEGG